MAWYGCSHGSHHDSSDDDGSEGVRIDEFDELESLWLDEEFGGPHRDEPHAPFHQRASASRVRAVQLQGASASGTEKKFTLCTTDRNSAPQQSSVKTREKYVVAHGNKHTDKTSGDHGCCVTKEPEAPMREAPKEQAKPAPSEVQHVPGVGDGVK
ncbi:uncharacterized protein LOC144162225 [Haemaphysalis longicornis]